jgi:hypothetical protein
MTQKESSYHTNWQKNRINFILSKYPKDFFKGKRILELGAFNGYIGSFFSNLGATVHCIEGRLENVEQIKNDYPNVTVEHANLDTPEWKWGKWDIIINFGLFYHLENFHQQHLNNCIQNCNLMFFESVIFDSYESTIFYRNESGVDQSLGETGGTPSTQYVENILNSHDVLYKKISNGSLNGDLHHYDWIDENRNILDPYARRFWIIEKIHY